MIRIVVAYCPCARKAKGLKTVYQQHIQYIQTRGLQIDPVTLFDSNPSKKIKEWRCVGERIVLVINVNGHPLHNDLYRQLQEHRTEMEEFSHKCWGPKSSIYTPCWKIPYRWGIQISGSGDCQLINLCMLTFAESPGDHWSLCFDISTRSLLGKFRYKICQPVSWRLVTSQPSFVKQYNEILQEKFEIHRIVEWLDAIDKMMRYCGYPSPGWLCAMIIKLYKQMTEIRVQAKKRCRKILQQRVTLAQPLRWGTIESMHTFK